jgi:hypothetical protein
MFEFDDMIYSLNVAIAICFVVAGFGLSIHWVFEYAGENARLFAVLVGAAWVYISFRVFRFFRMWMLQDEVNRKEFHLKYMDLNDPWRREFIEMKNEAASKLETLRQD